MLSRTYLVSRSIFMTWRHLFMKIEYKFSLKKMRMPSIPWRRKIMQKRRKDEKCAFNERKKIQKYWQHLSWPEMKAILGWYLTEDKRTEEFHFLRVIECGGYLSGLNSKIFSYLALPVQHRLNAWLSMRNVVREDTPPNRWGANLVLLRMEIRETIDCREKKEKSWNLFSSKR